MYLNTHTYFSLRYGTMPAKDLLAEAQKCGVRTFALTDINNTSACLNFVRIAPEYDIKPILGIDFRNGVHQQFIGIAKNNEGFYELNCFLSEHLATGKKIPSEAPVFDHAFIVYPFATFKGAPLKENEYLGVAPRDLNKLRFSEWKNRMDRLVILQTVTFRNKRDFNAHRLLRAIDKNTLLSKLSKTEEGSEQHVMLPEKELLQLYAEFPEIIENTGQLLQKCSISFEFGSEHPPKNKKTYTSSEEEDYRLLLQLCNEGLPYRYSQLG